MKTKVTKPIKDRIIMLFELGVTPGDISDIMNLSIKELHDIVSDNEKIESAKKKGVLSTNLKVLEGLLKAAIGHTTIDTMTEKKYRADGISLAYKTTITNKKEHAPNVQACKFWLDNRDSEWKDSMKEVEEKLNVNITIDGNDIRINKE